MLSKFTLNSRDGLLGRKKLKNNNRKNKHVGLAYFDDIWTLIHVYLQFYKLFEN